MKETPIGELFVDGMSDEQVWAQLELRAQNMCEVLDYALDGPAEGAESDSEDDERKLKKMRQALIDEGFDPAELEDLGLDEGDSEDEEDSEDDDEDEDDDEEEDEESEEDDGEDADLGEGVEELRDPSDEDDDDDPEIGEPSFLNGGKRTVKVKPRRGGHPVLDDGFFDLAAFNAEVEAAESKKVSRGRLSKDDDDDEDEDEEDEDIDYFASVDDSAAFDEEDLEDAGGGMCMHFFHCGFPLIVHRTSLPGLLRTSKSSKAPEAGKGE